MDSATASSVLAVLVIGAVVFAGPAVGFGPDNRGEVELDDGTAAVESVTLTGPVTVTSGRFGAGVAYLRIPDLRVRFSAVSGHPRVVYRVTVPGLGFDRVGSRLLGGSPTRVDVGMADRAYPPGELDRARYRATVTARIQSFAVDRTVFRRNVTVEVRVDG